MSLSPPKALKECSESDGSRTVYKNAEQNMKKQNIEELEKKNDVMMSFYSYCFKL